MRGKGVKAAGIMAIAASSFMALGWTFFDLLIRGRKKGASHKKWFRLKHTRINHPRDKFEKKYEAGKAWCMNQKMEDCYLYSVDGLKLHAYFLPAKGAKRIVILCHGYRGSGFGDFANTAKFLHEHECHLLFIDERCCGKSEGKYITFGAREQYDVQRWAYYAAKRNKKKLPIYLYGMSMGGASVLMASGLRLPGAVRGLIVDCAFQSMRVQLKDIAAHWFHVKWIELLLFRVDFFCRALGGFCMKEADTTAALKKNRRPVLFFHGELDTYVSPNNSQYNYAMCRAKKELVLVEGARHLCSPYVEEEKYRDKLLEFFWQNESKII